MIYIASALDIKITDKKYVKMFKSIRYANDAGIILREVKTGDVSYNIYFVFLKYDNDKYTTELHYNGDTKTISITTNNSDPDIMYYFREFLLSRGEKL